MFVPGGQTAVGATIGRIGQGIRAIGGGAKAQNIAKIGAATGGQSALYGAGAADEGDRLSGAAISGTAGAVAGPAISAVAPRITQGASELIKKGIPLTPGQATGQSGIIGRGLKRFEESVADNVFIIGDAIRAAFDRGLRGFNRSAVQQSLDPANIKLPKNLEGKQLINFGQKALSTNYDRVLGKTKLTNELDLMSKLNVLTSDLPENIKKDIESRIKNIISKRFVNDEMPGKSVKKVQTFLRRDIQRLRRDGSELAASKADALEDIRSVFNKELQIQNPNQAPVLRGIDKAYGQFEIVRNAELRRKTTEGFLPGDLLQATAKGDPTKRQSQFAAGEARMQNFATQAQNIMGNVTPNSGTAQRREANRLLTGGTLAGGAYFEPTTSLLSAATAPILYSQPALPVTRALVGGAGRALQSAVPVASAQAQNNELLARLLQNR